MSRYEVELLDLAKEIAAVEGIPLAAALERAAVELRGLVVYGGFCLTPQKGQIRWFSSRNSPRHVSQKVYLTRKLSV